MRIDYTSKPTLSLQVIALLLILAAPPDFYQVAMPDCHVAIALPLILAGSLEFCNPIRGVGDSVRCVSESKTAPIHVTRSTDLPA